MGGRNSAAATPVLLNVYDLTAANDYLYWFGFGVFHSGIEVHGTEYGFGAHDFPSSGVFEVESKTCPGFVYRRTVWLGTTDMSQEEFRSFIEKLAGKYHGNTYHLINKNCNHFTDDVCQSLTGKPIPSWVNRLARVRFLIVFYQKVFKFLLWVVSQLFVKVLMMICIQYIHQSLKIATMMRMRPSTCCQLHPMTRIL
ncbi:unnamed protein product [Urochloa decumbens]|uniref:PPPDE domain-containing protein n=1 Tax=Urochloa decumbens TaxID=240449 RepID=A0ABC9EGA9_9POAL